MSLKPATPVTNPYPESLAEEGLGWLQMDPTRGAVTRTDLVFIEEVGDV